MLVIDDREETIEEEIEDSHETNNQQRGQGSPKTPLDSRGNRISKTREDLNQSPYLDEPIQYTASLKKKDAMVLQEQTLPLFTNTKTNSNNKDPYNADYDKSHDPKSDSKKSHTFGRRTRLENEDDSPSRNNIKAMIVESDYYQRDLLDKNITENKKKLLYDKQLKAYYDPETGQYFEMRDQLINQGNLKSETR